MTYHFISSTLFLMNDQGGEVGSNQLENNGSKLNRDCKMNGVRNLCFKHPS
jgi:hypothetical protein